MIKYACYEFSELDVPSHWLAFPSFGDCLRGDVSYAKDWREVGIRLNPNETYQLSMDQSTSNTGIFIKNYCNTEAYMIEVKGTTGQNPGEYIYNLELFLHSLLEGQTLSHVLYETPIKGVSFQSARVLFQLEGMIQSLPLRYDEFKTAKLDSIANSSWRSVIIDPKRFPETNGGRKAQSRDAVCDLYHWTHVYGPSQGKDQDVYEAIGIMMGWFYASFDAFGRPYVRGSASTTTIGVLVLPGEEGAEVVKSLKASGIDAMFEVENPNYSIVQNLTTKIAHYGVLCVEFTKPYTMLSLCIESNIQWKPYKCITCILSNVNYMNAKLKELCGGEFQFVI